MPDILYYKVQEKRKKEAEKMQNRKQEFLGVRREERKRVLDELLERMKAYEFEIKFNELEKIVNELKEKDFEKKRKFN